MRTIVSADRTCDLNQETLDEYHVQTIPYHIILDDVEYFDNIDITLTEVYAAWKDHKGLPKTSAVNVEEYITYFRRLADEAGEECEIVHICLGSALSSSYQNCCLAAQELGMVYPVDSCTLSSASGLQVIDAAEMVRSGSSAAEVQSFLQDNIKRYHASFVIDTLEYLHAGGRCSSLAALASAALNIKPSIIVDAYNGGAMTVGKKYRGKFDKVLGQYVRDKLAEYDDIDYAKCMITSAMTLPDCDEYGIIRKILKEETDFEVIYETVASCTIGSHCGPGTIGILFETFSNRK